KCASEIPYDQVKVAVVIPIDGEGPGADVLGHGLAVEGNDQRLAIGPFQDLGFEKGAVFLAVQDLKQPSHWLLHTGIRAGQNVAKPVTVDVHQLWSRTGASPHARHFGRLPVHLQPIARGNLFAFEVFKDLDSAARELSDEQRHFAVALEVGQARGCVAWALHTDRIITRLQPYWRLEVGSIRARAAGRNQQRREPQSLHRTLLP